jgi:apolipoprotein N-acyltransferase
MRKPRVVIGCLVAAAIVVGGVTWIANHFEQSVKLISAISPVITVSLALLAMHVWRVRLVTRRRFEVAEEALQTGVAADPACPPRRVRRQRVRQWPWGEYDDDLA